MLHTCTVTVWGEVFCEGDNEWGQLGTGSASPWASGANRVVSLDGVTHAVSGAQHTCALRDNGEVWCWGDGSQGQLGDGTTTNSNVPVQALGGVTVESLSSNGVKSMGTCLVTTTGGAKCWGDNATGQVGDGTTIDALAPVDVSGLTSGVDQITTSVSHSCATLTAGGVMCWGANLSGELGDGTTTDRLTPVAVVGL